LTAVQQIEGINFYNTSNGTNNQTPYTQNINGVPTTCVPIVNPVAKFLFASANQKLFPLPNAAPTVNTATSGNYVGIRPTPLKMTRAIFALTTPSAAKTP